MRTGIFTLAVTFLMPPNFSLANEDKAPAERKIQLSVTDKGFEPNSVKVKKGQPVSLVITRKTDKTCAKDIVIDEYNIKEKLPLNAPVTVKFTPKKSGELKYGCAMGKMISGVIHVE